MKGTADADRTRAAGRPGSAARSQPQGRDAFLRDVETVLEAPAPGSWRRLELRLDGD